MSLFYNPSPPVELITSVVCGSGDGVVVVVVVVVVVGGKPGQQYCRPMSVHSEFAQ